MSTIPQMPLGDLIRQCKVDHSLWSLIPSVATKEPDEVIHEKCYAARAFYAYENIAALLNDMNMRGVGGADALCGHLPVVEFNQLSRVCSYVPELTPKVMLYVYRTPQARAGEVYMRSYVSTFSNGSYKAEAYDNKFANIAIKMSQVPNFDSSALYSQIFDLWLQGRSFIK